MLKSRYRWTMLALAWLIYFSFGLTMSALPPLVTPIMTDLGLSFTQMGIVGGAWALVYIFFAYPAGLFVHRLGTYKTLLVGATTISFSAALRGFVSTFGGLFFAVCLFGFGGPLISIGLPKLISAWFADRERGTASGIYFTGSAAGAMTALAITNSVVLPIVGSWRKVFFSYSAVGFLIAGFWLFLGSRPLPHKGSEGEQTGDAAKMLKDKDVWIVVIIGVTSFLGTSGLINWLPKILEVSGMPAASAGFVASFLHVYRTIGSIILPRVSYYLRSKRLTIMSVLFIAGIAILTTGLSKGILLWVSIFFSGVTIGSLMPLLLLTLMDMPQVGAKYMGIAGGMFFSIGEIGGFLGPFLMGYLKDITGSFLTGLIFLSVVCEIMFVLASFIKEKSRE